MVFVDTTLDELLSKIGFREIVREDILIPAKDPNAFLIPGRDPVVALQPKSKYVIDLEHFLWDRNPRWVASAIAYYGGKEAYERSKVTINPEFIAEQGTLLENAFWHGNNNDSNLSVKVTIQEGDRGHIITVTDQGLGFDYKVMLERARRGERYFKFKGAGLRSVLEDKWEVAYSPPGNQVHLLYPDAMLWTPPVQVAK